MSPRIDPPTHPSLHAPRPPDADERRQHTVRERETLQQIASDHRTTRQAILDANPQVRDPDRLQPGDVLEIPDVEADPGVTGTVDAIIDGAATPEQRNAAYGLVQDRADGAGGIGDDGLPAGSLAAESLALLDAAGIPTVRPEVVESVDRVIGDGASLEQRLGAYAAVREYVDRAGGIGDGGVLPEALPAQASRMLHERGVPVALRAEVVEAVDGLLAPDATQAQRDDAYAGVQAYVDRVGGIGDAGIVAEALPAGAARILVEQGNGGLRFSAEVVDAVERGIAPQSTDPDRLAAYESVQAYVDRVGGIGDAGIVAEALPAQAVRLMQDEGIAVNTAIPDDATAADVALAAQAGATPQERLAILGTGYADAAPPVRAELLADPDVQRIVQEAADAATAPLGMSPEALGGGEAVPALEAIRELDAMTSGLDPELAAALLDASAPAFSSYARNDLGGPVGPEGMATLLEVFERVRGTATGDAAIGTFAELGFYDFNAVPNHIAQGGSPAYSMALGNHEEAIVGAETFAAATLEGDAQDYIDHMEELNYLISSGAGMMTPEQLDDAVAGYIDEQGPDWEQRLETLQNRLAGDGAALLDQVTALNAGIDAVPADQRGAFGERTAALLEDPLAQLAVTTALRQNPELVRGERGDDLLRTFADLGITGDANPLAAAATAAYLGENVLDPSTDLDIADPASLERARDGLEAALRDNAALAGVMEVTPAQLDELADGLLELIPATPQSIDPAANALAVSRSLNNTIDKIDAALGRDTPYGTQFRAAALGLSTATLANSIDTVMADPSLRNTLQLMVDSARVGVNGSEFVAALRNVPEGTTTVAWLKTLSKSVHLAGAGLAGLDAIGRLAQGDLPGAGLNAAIAGGVGYAVLGQGAWAGPIGFGIATAAALGLFVYDGVRSAQHNSRFETATTERFLAEAGLDPEAAAALRDQSGGGVSPVPILTTYAEHKGYDMENPDQRQAFVDWINDMPPAQLSGLRDALHRALDHYGGDHTRLEADRTRPQTEYYVNPSTGSATPRISVFEVRSVGEIDAFLAQRGADPLPVA